MRSKKSRHAVLILTIFLTTATFAPVQTVATPPPRPQDQLRELIRDQLEFYTGKVPESRNNLTAIRSIGAMKEFYEKRGFEPAWVGGNRSGEKVRQLIQAIEQAPREGLNPREYHLEQISNFAGEFNLNRHAEDKDIPVKLANFELLLTDAFFLYARHLFSGRISPKIIDSGWVSNKRKVNLPFLLEDGLARDRIEEALSQLPPSHIGYIMLRKALSYYRSVDNSTFPHVELPQGKAVKQGDVGTTVQAIRRRLHSENGFLSGQQENGATGSFFDEELENSVRRFQQQHGLEPDGIVGPRTTAAMNRPASEKIQQIILNMERWRWLPQDLGPKHIIVNIADYTLQVFDNGRQVLDMKVVVGRDYRRTPVFSDQIRYLVLNPSWHVPHSIAVRDKLPLLRKDPGILKKDGFHVYQRTEDGPREIAFTSVNWNNVSSRNFPYTLRQAPGPDNALGTIKFMFPNKFNVYLHDTPSRDLFNRSVRSYSSGCVRLEKPLELGVFLLNSDKWSISALQRAIASKKEQTIILEDKVPIHILYLTAFIDQSGNMQFRPDIYGRDALLKRAW